MEPSEGWGDASEGAVGIDARVEGLADCQPGVGTHPDRHGEPVVADGRSAGVREQPTDACRHFTGGVRAGVSAAAADGAAQPHGPRFLPPARRQA
jgi:hypothetical protein